jgi:chromosome segregation ATPase
MSKPTIFKLTDWVARLSPDASQIDRLKDRIAKWEEKLQSLNDPYDQEICDFHIQTLRSQISVIECELQVLDAYKVGNFERVRELADRQSDLNDKVSLHRARIYNAKQADALIGKSHPTV